LVVLAALTLKAQDQSVGRGVNFYSTEKETALGAELAKDFRQAHAALDNAAARDYIEAMGARLARSAPQPSPFTYHFELTSDSTGTFLEPAAFPGGFVFVPAGLILAAKDEAELAGTLAHAIAHIAARHGTRQATKAALAQQGTIPLIFASGSSGYGTDQGQAALVPMGVLQFQRAMESEADRLAVGITSAAGYDPEGLARYIGRVQQDPAQSVPPATSALPSREQRLRAMNQAIQAAPARSYAASGDFARIQDEVRRALPPPPPKPTLQR
jgi:predicted Zn-dependent protease